MKNSMRNWHNWISVALGIPLLLVGLTTFFIAHEKRLGTKEVMLPLNSVMDEPLEVRSSVWLDQQQWLGTKNGVFRLEGTQAQSVAGTPNDEIRSMHPFGTALLLAGKQGLWWFENGRSQRVYKADCWHVGADKSGVVAACKDMGLLASVDGKAWSPQAVLFPKQAMTAQETGMPLSKVIMDIHTGKFFFGKQYEWIWIDLLGLACVLLGLTGLVMWMRNRRQRISLAS